MATLDAPVLEKVQRVCREIALRAERLDELVKLGYQFRALEISYNNVSGEIKASTSSQNPNWPRLSDLWANCRDNDFVELKNFIQSAKKIRQPLPAEPENGLGPEIDRWLNELQDVSGSLDKALDELSRPNLMKFSPAFLTAFKTGMARHKNIVSREASELCSLTEKLKESLEA
jgi:hypothetical protein